MINSKKVQVKLLSFFLNNETPAYGNSEGINFQTDKSIIQGDSCNSISIKMPNHIGTHTDAPLHFIHGGRSITSFKAEEFFFYKVFILELFMDEGRILSEKDFEALPINEDIDLVFIKTNFTKYRTLDKNKYILNGPGFSAESAEIILKKFPNIRALGLDFISINSYQNRPAGRAAHIIFLGYHGLLIFEDMNLSAVTKAQVPYLVIAAPMLIQDADGAPTTIYALFNKDLS